MWVLMQAFYQMAMLATKLGAPTSRPSGLLVRGLVWVVLPHGSVDRSMCRLSCMTLHRGTVSKMQPYSLRSVALPTGHCPSAFWHGSTRLKYSAWQHLIGT